MALSEFAVRKAKPRDKAYELFDGGGLFLHVQPNGSRHRRLKYRFSGNENLVSFGPYPGGTIDDARKRRAAAKAHLAAGDDPAEMGKSERLAAQAPAEQTFGLIAEEYMVRLETNGAAARTLSRSRWLLDKVAAPSRERPIREITAAEILDGFRRSRRAAGLIRLEGGGALSAAPFGTRS